MLSPWVSTCQMLTETYLLSLSSSLLQAFRRTSRDTMKFTPFFCRCGPQPLLLKQCSDFMRGVFGCCSHPYSQLFLSVFSYSWKVSISLSVAVLLSAYISMAAATHIFVQFDSGDNPNLVKIEQKYWALHMKPQVYFIVPSNIKCKRVHCWISMGMFSVLITVLTLPVLNLKFSSYLIENTMCFI